MGKIYNCYYTWFVWVSIHCELRMNKQDLQAGES